VSLTLKLGKGLLCELNEAIICTAAHGFKAALDYWWEKTRKWLVVPDSRGFWTRLEPGTMLWIRNSTKQLCLEVRDNNERDLTSFPWGLLGGPLSCRVHLISDTNLEDKVQLFNMCPDDVHHIFSASDWGCWIDIDKPGTIWLGSLSWPTASSERLFNPFSELSILERVGLSDVYEKGWEYADPHIAAASFPHEDVVILGKTWTRYARYFQPVIAVDQKLSIALADLCIREECCLRKGIYITPAAMLKLRKTWLSQANYIMAKSGLGAGNLPSQINFTPN
jgi:hypothetical protein